MSHCQRFRTIRKRYPSAAFPVHETRCFRISQRPLRGAEGNGDVSLAETGKRKRLETVTRSQPVPMSVFSLHCFRRTLESAYKVRHVASQNLSKLPQWQAYSPLRWEHPHRLQP